MNKQFLALVLAANCITSQCKENQKPEVTEEEIALAQVEAAREELKNMNNSWTKAEMGATTAAVGLILSLATVYVGKNNPELQNYVLATCSTAVGAGLFVTWTSENQRGNPQERAKLITIIENSRKVML